MAVDAVATTAPASPATGATWFNPDDGILSVWTGSAWARAVPDPTPTQPGPVSVSVAGIAAALRIAADGASLDADNTAILTRLGGVGEALVELYASTAPSAIKSEAVIRVAAYLYDMPETPSGMRYAAAWQSSGAALLVQPWQSRRAVYAPDDEVDAAVAGGTTAGGGLDAGAVRALIAAYLRDNPPAGGGGGLTASQVDDRIAALVEPYVTRGSDQRFPVAKLPTGVATDAEVAQAIGALVLGLSQQQVDARIMAYTGQVSASGTLARDRLQLATASEPGVVAAVHQAWYEARASDPRFTDALHTDVVTADVFVTDRASDPRFTAALATKLAGIAAGANAFQLATLLDEFGADLRGEGWSIVANATATAHSGSPATLAQVTGYTYASAYELGTAVEAAWFYFRLPTDTALDDYQVRVAESDGGRPAFRLEANTAVAYGGPTPPDGFDYYRIQIANKPGGFAVILVEYHGLTSARFTLPWGQITEQPTIPEAVDISGLLPWPASRQTLPATPWRRGQEFFNDSGAALPYGAPREFPIVEQDTLYSVAIGTADSTGRIASIAAFKTGAPNVGANAVAGGVYFIGSSGGSSDTLPNTVQVYQQQYNNALAFAFGGNNYYRITNLSTATFIAGAPGHPANIVLLDWTRADGTPLNPAGSCPEGAVVWDLVDDVGVWRPTPGGAGAGASMVTSIADDVSLSRTHANRNNAIAVPGVTVPEGKVWAISVLSGRNEYSSVFHTDIIREIDALTAGTGMTAVNAITMGGAFGFGFLGRTSANGLLIAAASGTDDEVSGAQAFRLWIEQLG